MTIASCLVSFQIEAFVSGLQSLSTLKSGGRRLGDSANGRKLNIVQSVAKMMRSTVCIYIYIYMYTERDRETEIHRHHGELYARTEIVNVYIYIYMGRSVVISILW